MSIEQATIRDIPALVELLSALFSQEEEFTPEPKKQIKGLTKIIDNPEIGTIIIARKNKKIIGMVNILFTVSTALGERVALLEDMVITAPFRKVGVGSQLLTNAIAYAKVYGCKRITLLTDKTNETAQCFYQQQGFYLSSMIPMRISLD
ncbi:MAG: GNAT family N-acetyltransferase [Gammaproteobacteria bacterium]|nr:MAG: GNAT family N-acetyltransferase [Gammaproteobacteria bacterium]